MFDDLIKTIKAQLYDRIASPLFSSYLISWVGWNYKFLLTVFSGMKVNEKLDFISGVVYPSFNYLLLHGALYPLITSMLIIFVYPYPAKFTYQFYRRRQVEIKEIQQKIDDETPLTREEAKKIRTDALIMSVDFEKEIEKLREENILLRKLIKDSNTENSTYEGAGKLSAEGKDGTAEFGDSETQFSEPSKTKIEKEPLVDEYGNDREVSPNYFPIYERKDKKGHAKLLVTGPDLIKNSIEDLISSNKLFSGRSFMVSVENNKLIVSMIDEEGEVIDFKYDFHVPSKGSIGYEKQRLETLFEKEFRAFLEGKHTIEEE